MRRYYFNKVGAAPIWIHVPGTPFTLPGERTQYARLPGMSEWAPHEVIERVGKGLDEGLPTDAIAEQEAKRGLLANTGKWGTGGGILGAMGARISSGEAATAPFKEIGRKGITAQTLKGLKNIPLPAKILPLLGAGVGATLGYQGWAQGRDKRRNEARQVSKGLLSEKILQQHAIQKARESVLQRMKPETASEPAPKAVVLGDRGI